MEIIAIIVSGLALLAAGVCLLMLTEEKKRNQERNAAEKELRGQIDWCIGAIGEETTNRTKAVDHFKKEISDACFRLQNRLLQEMYTEFKLAYERIEKLEKGVVPDYEKAIAAADAVNKFNEGLSNILGYDPVEALEAQRRKENG